MDYALTGHSQCLDEMQDFLQPPTRKRASHYLNILYDS